MFPFVFYFAIQKFKDKDIQNYKFARMGVKIGRWH
jgi:hypothetical protein